MSPSPPAKRNPSRRRGLALGRPAKFPNPSQLQSVDSTGRRRLGASSLRGRPSGRRRLGQSSAFVPFAASSLVTRQSHPSCEFGTLQSNPSHFRSFDLATLGIVLLPKRNNTQALRIISLHQCQALEQLDIIKFRPPDAIYEVIAGCI